MKRAILSVFLVGTAGLLLAIPACQDQGVGDPCTPEQEYEPSFIGFDEKEVNVESKSFQCQTRICLANHFQGRVSCPYGQDADGKAPNGPVVAKLTVLAVKSAVLLKLALVLSLTTPAASTY